MTTKDIYDIFRNIQAKRKACYDGRSANFILEGQMAQTIYQKRQQKNIPAAITFNHKEGPDEAIVYTLISDELLKGDYYVFRNVNYLTIEEDKLTDNDVSFRKSRAVECNVSFTFKGEVYIGYFKSKMRGNETPDFKNKGVLLPDEGPLLILPTSNALPLQEDFIIKGKPFKVVEVDQISNRGITYHYLERGIERELGEENIGETGTGGKNSLPETPEPELYAMQEYTFETEDAFFSATPAVEVISRKRIETRFRVPFGLSNVAITIKKDGEEHTTNYKVVM